MIRSFRRFRRHNDGFYPAELSNNSRRDSRARNQDDNLAVARCPICGHRLVARLDCQGPYFYCLCVRPRRAA
jgi:hypothetical protein